MKNKVLLILVLVLLASNAFGFDMSFKGTAERHQRAMDQQNTQREMRQIKQRSTQRANEIAEQQQTQQEQIDSLKEQIEELNKKLQQQPK